MISFELKIDKNKSSSCEVVRNMVLIIYSMMGQ